MRAGRDITAELVESLAPEERAKIKAGGFIGESSIARPNIFTTISTQDRFEGFLTLPLYQEI